jgi:hypothetical protein
MLAFAYGMNIDHDPEFQRSLSQIVAEIAQHFAGFPMTPHRNEIHIFFVVTLGLVPLFLLDWIAIAWLSTWFSLRVKQPLFAPISALVVLHLPPLLFFGFLVAYLQNHNYFPNHNFSESILIFMIGATLLVLTQILCIAWCRRQIFKHFRTAATDRYQPKPPRRWWQFRIA